MGADARLINRFGLASATRWPRLIKPSDFQASRSPRARRVYTTLIAPGRRYRSVNLYYSARTMRLPARVYLKLDPCTSSAVARARARARAWHHCRENLSMRCRRRGTSTRRAALNELPIRTKETITRPISIFAPIRHRVRRLGRDA